MPGDSSHLESGELSRLVREIISEVLMVPIEEVRPQTALIADLGAESIDFLDLIFRLDEALGKRIPIDHWNRFVEQQVASHDLPHAITTEFVRAFAFNESLRA